MLMCYNSNLAKILCFYGNFIKLLFYYAAMVTSPSWLGSYWAGFGRECYRRGWLGRVVWGTDSV